MAEIEIKTCYVDCMLNMTTCKLSKYVVDEREEIWNQPIKGHYEPGPNCPGPGTYEIYRKGTGKWVSNEAKLTLRNKIMKMWQTVTPPRLRVMGKWLTPICTWRNFLIDNYRELHQWRCWIFGHNWLECPSFQGAKQLEMCKNCLEFREIPK